LSWAEGSGPAANAGLPLVLHLILDEQTSVDGLRAHSPEAADELRAFFERRGFRILAGAYSQFALTTHSLAQALNLMPGQPIAGEVRDASGESRNELSRAVYLERMAEAGYGLQVYQTEWLDLCGAVRRPIRCETAAVTRLGILQNEPLTALQKLSVIGRTYAGRSRAFDAMSRAAGRGAAIFGDDHAADVRLGLGTTPYSTVAGRAMFRKKRRASCLRFSEQPKVERMVL
jgi:hypothetical protein